MEGGKKTKMDLAKCDLYTTDLVFLCVLKVFTAFGNNEQCTEVHASDIHWLAFRCLATSEAPPQRLNQLTI